MFEQFPHVLGEFYGTPWLISATKFDEIEFALLNRLRNGASAVVVPEAARPTKREIRATSGDIAVIDVSGTLTARPSIMSSGGASCAEIAEALSEAMGDEDVSAVAIRFNTPGGQVAGIQELGDMIAGAKKTKPIHAVAEHLCCSAGMWLASQCTSISAAPNSTVGSIGVVVKVLDQSKALEAAGVSMNIITAGRRKAEGDSSRPLTEEAITSIQKTFDALYEKFVSAIASCRSVSATKVRSAEWGEGATLMADDALAVGMIDRIATMGEIIGQLRAKSNASRSRSAKMAVANAQGKLLG